MSYGRGAAFPGGGRGDKPTAPQLAAVIKGHHTHLEGLVCIWRIFGIQVENGHLCLQSCTGTEPCAPIKSFASVDTSGGPKKPRVQGTCCAITHGQPSLQTSLHRRAQSSCKNTNSEKCLGCSPQGIWQQVLHATRLSSISHPRDKWW